MDLIDLVRGEYLSIIFGGLGGIFTAWLTQKVINRRGLFSYFVTHNRVGMSSEDSLFGNVSVKWNNNPVNHLFLSTVELKNESLNDYENVIIQTYSDDTNLLSESTQILDTPNIIDWTEKFATKLHVTPGEDPTEAQHDIYNSQREYLIPVFNRGQQIRISYLNAAKSGETPTIWLSATLKGVKVKFQAPQNQIYEVPQPLAASVGVVLGLVGLIPLVIFVSNNWAVALIAISYGFIAQLPGVFVIKAYRKFREFIGG